MSAIFYHDETQQRLAEKTKTEHQKHIARPIVTLIQKAGPFYNAEDYHQKYMLRRHSKVIDRLNLTDEELIKSKAACRLNGYLSGYGTEEGFLKEVDDLDIKESVVGYVQQQIKKSKRY
ncbi:peptide methionine sulfoxide reductase-like [Mercenaria mercenaria]|uniref:peptide methionine sulfoxide reductase-like n=1 Tax=Mercenaria mercenaria TaxID=6596 RepID=UPI00234E3742|nr:peptide methionine sulfoxide reductase-like [Mercenaria mercenaria]